VNKSLLKSHEALERQKHAFLSRVAGLSTSQLHFRPVPGSWSVSDILDHLVRVEKELLTAVRAELPSGTARGLRDRIGAVFIICVMLSPMRVKAPASVPGILPQTTTDPTNTALRWAEVRTEMADLLGRLRTDQLRAGLFRHPVSGWMTIQQALTFLSAHMRHHTYQLNRLMSAMRNTRVEATTKTSGQTK
jgi:uncharacterized damage-inducible protein DinB